MDGSNLSTVRDQLHANAARHGLASAQVRVARGSEGGLRIRVVHERLAGLTEAQRKETLLSDVEGELEEVQLLTPDEEAWYGPPFPEVEGALPVWPEALAQEPATDLLFASDLDDGLDPPVVATFYSLKGGVGRTTALAGTARVLAARGYRVLAVDMDFEAPGLPYLFGLSEPDESIGALPLLLALEQGDPVDIRDHVARVGETELYCLPAGRLGVEYARRLQLLEPELWYRESPNPLHGLVEEASRSSLQPDFILLDSRTGVSPISAPLLFDLADLAVVCFYPHPQAYTGTELLVRSLLSARTRRAVAGRALSPEPRFLVSPVPPGPSAAAVWERARTWVYEWLAPAVDRRPAAVGELRAEDLTHFVGYSAETAFADTLTLSPAAQETYGPLADWLEQLLPQPAEPDAPAAPATKERALAELTFSTGTAEAPDKLLDDFVETPVFTKALHPRYPLVLGRKGTGKTTLFRWLLEGEHGGSAVPVTCPAALRDRYPWILSSSGFETVATALRGDDDWPRFWECYVALAAHLVAQPGRVPPPDEFAAALPVTDARDIDELETFEALRGMLARPSAALLARRWLKAMDAVAAGPCFLLFDGLDTGFGSTQDSRRRRTAAVSGLFAYLTEAEVELRNLAFKVLLRSDIWQTLRFENKTHLYGRSLLLRWRDQADYFKTVLKQTLRSPMFREMVTQSGVRPEVDRWSEQEVFHAWNLLVGERMKGGKTAFTRNWVWNRLADGNRDHSPRALAQLFHRAAELERDEQERTPYDRSVIRPRLLVQSLETVSNQAIEALLEEFPEIEGLTRALRQIGRTPFTPGEVATVSEDAPNQLDLAREAGLVEIYEGTEQDVHRYKVPDLYRHALNITRKGQA